MDKLESLRVKVNGVLSGQKDACLQAAGWVHLYAVSQAAELLALKRGLDVCMCTAAGLLHDIYTYRTGQEADHAQRGSEEAPDMLRAAGGWAEEEIGAISVMIARHSDKKAVNGPSDECLKDADVFAHWLYDREKKFDPSKKERLERAFGELGILGTVCEE